MCLLTQQGSSVQQHQVVPRYSTWWDSQDMQMLQSLLQDPQLDKQQLTPATPPVNDIVPAHLEQQEDQLLWALHAYAVAEPGTPAAIAEPPATDALPDDAATLGSPALVQQGGRMSPFVRPDSTEPAGALAEQPELQLPLPLPLPQQLPLPLPQQPSFATPVAESEIEAAFPACSDSQQILQCGQLPVETAAEQETHRMCCLMFAPRRIPSELLPPPVERVECERWDLEDDGPLAQPLEWFWEQQQGACTAKATAAVPTFAADRVSLVGAL